jgi:hypothetical protein
MDRTDINLIVPGGRSSIELVAKLANDLRDRFNVGTVTDSVPAGDDRNYRIIFSLTGHFTAQDVATFLQETTELMVRNEEHSNRIITLRLARQPK